MQFEYFWVRTCVRNTRIPLALTILAFAAGGYGFCQNPSALPYPNHRDRALSQVWSPDRGDGTYENPVLNADYSDPDVIRVGKRFYLVASSFNAIPGLPILESFDLVNWRIVAHALEQQPPFERYSKVQPGDGVWAPSIRYHHGQFYIFYPDPDVGIYMLKARHIEGPWSAPLLIKAAKGWIDPCPLWDNDRKAYLVSGLAASRAGAKSALILSRMRPDATGLLDSGTIVYDGHAQDTTIEGPKLYKRQGNYYIFAPAGGVATGWQVVLRSRNIYGPYERRVALRQGSTAVNGPHQGAWVNTGLGQDWFLHFQDLGWMGRVVHLEPMNWVDGWPRIGLQAEGSIGEPVSAYKKPHTWIQVPAENPADSDEFNGATLGLQWQWQANPEPTWGFPSQALGVLRLFSVPPPPGVGTLGETPAVLLQKVPAPVFSVTTKLNASFLNVGDHAGIVMMGKSYGYLALTRTDAGLVVRQVQGSPSGSTTRETVTAEAAVGTATVYLRMKVAQGLVSFAYSTDGEEFQAVGTAFSAAPGVWIGAKVGIFAGGQTQHGEFGYADFDWFRFQRF